MGTDFGTRLAAVGLGTRQEWSRTAAMIDAKSNQALAEIADLVPSAVRRQEIVEQDRYLSILGEHVDSVIAGLLNNMGDDAFELSPEQLARLCVALVKLQDIRFCHQQAILEEKLHTMRIAQKLGAQTFDQTGVCGLLEHAAESVCALPGLSRSMVFWRDGSILHAVATHFVDKDEWARECQLYSAETPYELGPGRPEAEIIRRQAPAIITDAMRDPNAFQPIIQKIETQSYVVAPIIAFGEVIATLHGDAYFDRRPVDELDRDAVAALADSLGRTMERALAIERLQVYQKSAEELARSASITVTGLVGVPAACGTDTSRSSPVSVRRNDVVAHLNAGEQEVLDLIVKGATNPQIAHTLFLSEDTVKSRVKRILRKLGASTRGQAVAIYLEHPGALAPGCPNPRGRPSK